MIGIVPQSLTLKLNGLGVVVTNVDMLIQLLATGTTHSYTLQTALADAAISGLTAASDSPTLDTLPVNFTASTTSGSGVSYQWDFGDGSVGTGRITDHIYPAPGIYTATVTASNSVNTVQANATITINELPNFRGLVWHDRDGDGLQGPGEPGLGGVTVTANGPGGLLSDTSGIDGSWRIDSAIGGIYTLNAALAGYILTTDLPLPIPLPDMGATLVNFGMAQPPAPGSGELVGRAFDDANGNSVMDGGETGLSGVTIALLAEGNVADTTATDASGFFAFVSVSPGVYVLRANAPGGYYPASLSSGELSLAAGDVQSAQFNFVGPGEVNGTITSGGGYPVAGVTLILQEEAGAAVNTAVTAANGGYTFASIPPSSYLLRIMPPPEYLLQDGQDTRLISVPGGGQVTEDWSLLRQGRLRIRSYLDGVVPFVPLGNAAFVISPTVGITSVVRTNGDGEAIVDGLTPGPYTIFPYTGTDPGDHTVSPAQRQVTIGLDTSVLADFFINFPRSIRFRCERHVSPNVPHGPPFPCLVSATVVAGGSAPPGSEVATAQLNGERVGLFSELTPGTYRITITPDPAVPEQAGWPVFEETVSLGEGDHREVSYPYNPTGGAVTIWGYAFYDRNQDGSRQTAANEANDSAANGLTVSLYALDGALITTTTTQPNVTYGPGYYEFPNLAPATYQTEISLRTGQFATTPLSVQRVVNAISPPEAAIFGYVKQFNAAIQGKIFYDNDADGQFSLESDDAIGGATLSLREAGGAALDTRATAADGTYNFYPLITGNYTLVLTPPAGSEDATTLAREVAVPSGGTSVTVDYALPPDDGKTRALVYLDQDFDGEPGVYERMAGLTVLRRYGGCPPIGGPTTDQAVSNADGLAQFETVVNSPICLSIIPSSLPEGIVLSYPDDSSGMELMRASSFVWLRLLPAGVLTVHPFWDMDGDFVFDANEPVVSEAMVAIPGHDTASSNTAGASFSLETGSYAVTVTPPNNMGVTIIQPQIATVSNGGASVLAIPLRYLGQINGTLTASGGNPPWANVTVILENLDSGAIQSASVATSSGYFAFNNAAPGTYRLRLQNSPPGWALANQPVFYYAAGGTLSQALTLVRLGSLTGLVYTDANGNGVKNGNESVNGNYDVTLVNNAGLPEQTANVAADGTFAFPNLVPGVQYAVTLDLGGGQFGAPGVAITQNPGWFTVGSAGLDVRIGLYPYPYSGSNQVNTVYGRVYEQVGAVKNPHAGAVLGYRRWNDNGGCTNNNPIVRTTTSDVDGYYRLLTDLIPSTWDFYCIVLLELPGMAQNMPDIVTSSAFYYQSTNGMVYYAGVEQRDVVVTPTGGAAVQRENTAGEVSWLAFRDDNGNGWRDGDEPALSGTVISAGTAQASSGADGAGTLSGLAVGEHLMTITPPPGYAVVGPAERMIWIEGAAVALGQIGFRPVGWLVGSVFADEDGDGWRAPDESGLGGITVNLSGPVTDSIVTTPDGSIALDGLPDGSYAVTLVAPSGFAPLPPSNVTLASGGVISLGLQPDGHVSGAVYHDWDGDGIRLPDETLLVHPVTMTLGTETTTLHAGKFLFWNVATGIYDLTAQYGAAIGASASPQSGGGVGIPVVPSGLVRGTLWLDANGDGLRQPWEVPLSGISVTLDSASSALTDEDGRYTFINVAPGDHSLHAALPERLSASTSNFSMTDVRGAAIGIAARAQTNYSIFLPLAVKP